MREPKVGDWVLYVLGQTDVEMITERRKDARATSDDIPIPCLYRGNPVYEGDTYPMLITRAWGASVSGLVASDGQPIRLANGTVFLDGNDTHWVGSRHEGEGLQQFAYRDESDADRMPTAIDYAYVVSSVDIEPRSFMAISGDEIAFVTDIERALRFDDEHSAMDALHMLMTKRKDGNESIPAALQIIEHGAL